MLSFLALLLDIVRIVFTIGLLIIFVLIGALIVLFTLVNILKYFRQLAYERRQRKTRKLIEKTWHEYPASFREVKTYSQADVDASLATYYRQAQQDQETIDKATEYRNGISD